MSTQPLAFRPPKKAASAQADRQAWPREEVAKLFDLPFNELMFRAQEAHRQHWPDGGVELATLLSIKTGGCAEDCGYCPQAAQYDTGVKVQKILPLEEVVATARAAKEHGATRFCMGAAWREPKDRDLVHVEEMVRAVKVLGMETCATLGCWAKGRPNA
jgi:biotin synthase